MASTIVSYLAEQHSSFTDEPLNDVDSLILSTIAYFNLEHGAIGRVVPSERIPLPIAICGISHNDLYGGIWLAHMNGDDFLAALLASPRFMELEVGYYVNEVSSHFEKQFAALTFYLPDNSIYVAFRGTDSTLAGWKENFNLTFMSEVPSQVSARSYLEDRATESPGCLFVGGHSKGGNLAEYAALTCRDQTFDTIERIFNHDGPGFSFQPNERILLDVYREKLSKTIPESSVFGLLMESRNCYRIVQSTGILFAQHASTHWVVDDNDFITSDAVSPEAAIVAGTMNNWAKTYDPDQREMFIDAVYDIVSSTNADTFSKLMENKSASALALAGAMAKMPADMRSTLFSMVRDIAPIMSTEAAKHSRNRNRP